MTNDTAETISTGKTTHDLGGCLCLEYLLDSIEVDGRLGFSGRQVDHDVLDDFGIHHSRKVGSRRGCAVGREDLEYRYGSSDTGKDSPLDNCP
jgi:hypothetical protein